MGILQRVALMVAIGGLLFSCRAKEKQQSAESIEPNLIQVQAIYDSENNRHLFKADVDTIPSGWTTFQFDNVSPMVHFMVLEQMPGGRTSQESKQEVFPVFQEAMDLINAGNREEGLAKLGELPEWFANVTFMGGPGFVSPGVSTKTTVKLKPGNYVLECYVKTAEGEFHSALGMFRDLYVTEDSTSAEAPENPTLQIGLSNDGFDVQGKVTPGKHLVAVTFNEPNPPLLANDVQLVRLGDKTNIDSVAKWIDWSLPNGLVSSAENPAPATFLGGTHEMPAGNTAYFTTEMQPGNYAWISERSAGEPLYKTFTVSEADKQTTSAY